MLSPRFKKNLGNQFRYAIVQGRGGNFLHHLMKRTDKRKKKSLRIFYFLPPESEFQHFARNPQCAALQMFTDKLRKYADKYL